MLAEAALQSYGLFGLLITILAHLAYNWYTNNLGAVEQLRKSIDHVDERLDGMAIIQYRHAKEIEDVDENEVRERLFNGDQVVFPSDFDNRAEDDGYVSDGGGHVWVAVDKPEGSDEGDER